MLPGHPEVLQSLLVPLDARKSQMTAESCLSESDERRVCLVLVRNLRLNSELIWLPTLRTWSFVGRGEFLLGMKGTGWDLATLVKSELFEGVVG